MTVDSVTVSTIVPVRPANAFQIFCEDIDRWWRRGPRYRQRSDSIVQFVEDHGSGTRRLVEVTPDGTNELGEVTRWAPPDLLQMRWQVPVGVVPRGETVVEVRFDAVGDGTRVAITHSGWTDLESGGAAASVIGLWWMDPLVDFRASTTRFHEG